MIVRIMLLLLRNLILFCTQEMERVMLDSLKWIIPVPFTLMLGRCMLEVAVRLYITAHILTKQLSSIELGMR